MYKFLIDLQEFFILNGSITIRNTNKFNFKCHLNKKIFFYKNILNLP